MISLTIDGNPVEVEEGSTILEAANKAGVDIPTLCYDPRLEPYGACRMCVVEVKNSPKLLPACTAPASKGMEVITESEKLTKIRRTILELQCVDHALDCPVCDAAGECKLQDLVYRLGLQTNRFHKTRRHDPPDTRSPLVERNLNRCIFCSRCVRICHEVQGVGAIGLINRGFETIVGPPFGEPLDCEFCGQCIATCPVGALTSKIFKFRARTWFLERTPSTCPHCGTGCRINVEHMKGKVYRITADVGEGVNDGNLCPKGRFGYEFVNQEDRLASPRVKRNGNLAGASWDEAINETVKGIEKVIAGGNSDSVGFLGSPRLTNEENYLLQKLARIGIGTNNVDTRARFGHVHAVRSARKAFGAPAPAPTYEAIAKAKTLVVVDSVLTETNPVIGNHILEAIRKQGAKLVVLSPRGSKLVRHADSWIQHAPGAAGTLVAGIARAMIDAGSHEKEAEQLEGFASFKTSLDAFDPAAMEKAAGVDADTVKRLAERIANEGPALFLMSLPSFENVKGAATWSAVHNLALLAGASGPGRLGVLTATEACNLQGALDMGAAPEFLPGLVPLEDEKARESLGRAWGQSLPATPGLDAQAMIEAAESGKLKALVVFGENPLFNFPDADRVEKALKNLALLVVADPYDTETARLAHVVFPASTFAEKSGTFTNTEMRIQAVGRAVDPPGEARPDWRILADLLEGFKQGAPYESPGDVAAEIASVQPAFRDLDDPARTGGEGVLWNAGAGENAPAFLPEPAPAIPETLKDGELALVTGALLNHAGTVTRHGPGLNQVVDRARLRIHPADAKASGLADGDRVSVKTAAGAVEAEVTVDEDMRKGAAFLPVHFEACRANRLTAPPDEHGERKPATVTLEKVKKAVATNA